MNNKVIKKINLAFILLFLIGTSLFVIYPLMYVVSGAFSPGNSIASLSIIPFGDGISFKHFERLFNDTNYVKWFQNTLYVAVCTSLATILIASLGAYVFSRFQFAMKKSMMMAMLILQIFPSFVGMVAIYVILLRIGGLDKLWGLILVYLAGNIPYNTWMVKSYIDTIPKSLDEAARIDGASHFRIFRSIIFPIARPIIIFLGITSFTAPWMDYIFPKMVLRSSDKQTLALGLYSSFLTEKKNEFTTFAAGALLIAIPFIIFFVVMQKTMITSMGGSAVKE
ncbi:sugar ABC transporter permease [Cellulosilyticum sp. ST5]|uniref:ABC-type transporter, integral membrane subunit n=1 Tax=Cellulosilyticum lentocellum (strain ATCC 49066 / DSM 5427 / NCIMB 11756 / RHM5) TaxID=642492 RepID=F2JNS7_CELLD|nr:MULTISPECIES: sugar ABC transporter permease [Cellulosilyticum]ADZ82425.1 ABC-type transporter, integral membrane subunit [Cellulosilyticum lentocellum DSM 5427]